MLDADIPQAQSSEFVAGKTPADFGLVPQANTNPTQSNLPMMWMLTSTDAIIDFEHYLKGDNYDPVNKVWINNDSLRMMNDTGIRFVIGAIHQNTGKAAHLTWFKEENDIRRKCLNINLMLIDIMLLKEEEFDVDPQNFDFIIETAMNFIHFSLLRSLGGNDKEFLEHITQQSIIHTYNDQQRQGQPNQQKTGIRRYLPF